MERLTNKTSIMGRKHDLAYGCASIWKKKLSKHYRYNLIEEAIDKLGQLEDLFEKYQINDIEELEIIIGRNLQDNNKLYTIPIETLEEYRIDKCGNVYSLKNKIYLKNHKNKQGYTYYMINQKQWLIHRLVAITFISNPNNFKEVNHKNEIKDDNRVENLEWCTVKENTIHSYKMGLQVPNQKQKESARKMCLETKSKKVCLIDKNNNILKEWNSITNASKELNIPSSCISRVCKNKRITTHKMRFMYK